MAMTNQTSAIKKFEAILGEQAIEVTAVTVDGEVWFRGSDVASACGYVNLRQAIRNHTDEQDRAQLKDFGGYPPAPS